MSALDPARLMALLGTSVLLIGELLVLLSLAPTLSLATPAEAARAAEWTFLVIAVVHWWWGAWCYVAYVDAVRSLLEAYWLFAVLGLAALPVFFLGRLDIFFGATGAAFLLLYGKYRHSLSRVRDARVLRYARRKMAYELAIGLSLLPGCAVARALPEALAPALAWLAVLGEVAVIAAMSVHVYPLLPQDDDLDGELEARSRAPSGRGRLILQATPDARTCTRERARRTG